MHEELPVVCFKVYFVFVLFVSVVCEARFWTNRAWCIRIEGLFTIFSSSNADTLVCVVFVKIELCGRDPCRFGTVRSINTSSIVDIATVGRANPPAQWGNCALFIDKGYHVRIFFVS